MFAFVSFSSFVFYLSSPFFFLFPSQPSYYLFLLILVLFISVFVSFSVSFRLQIFLFVYSIFITFILFFSIKLLFSFLSLAILSSFFCFISFHILLFCPFLLSFHLNKKETVVLLNISWYFFNQFQEFSTKMMIETGNQSNEMINLCFTAKENIGY